MPDAAPLLAAIASAPDDDLPRLVFADWLDEHGDADRAEFIRLQVHTARVGPLDPTWAPAKLREYDLFKANEAAWRTPTASQEGRYLFDHWRRGFPDCVLLSDVARGRLTNGEWANGFYNWTASATEQYDPWPGGAVRRVTFSGWQEGGGDLLWHPQLRSVTSLSLMEWYAAVGTDRLEAFVTDLSLLTPGHFPELTSLGFGDGDFNINAFDTLADSAVVESLTSLSLGFDDIPAIEGSDWRAAAARLFRAVAPQLESLSLDRPPPEVLAAFVATEWPRLMTVSLRSTTPDDIDALAAARLPALDDLIVWATSGNDRVFWSDDTVDHLTRWPAVRGLKELAVSDVNTLSAGRLLGRLDTPELVKLDVFGKYQAECRLTAADLAERDTFRGLKNLNGPFTNADLAVLTDPDVLPELHTIWSDDTDWLRGRRWRGGVRAVIPRDPPGEWRNRPTRGSWCGGS